MYHTVFVTVMSVTYMTEQNPRHPKTQSQDAMKRILLMRFPHRAVTCSLESSHQYAWSMYDLWVSFVLWLWKFTANSSTIELVIQSNPSAYSSTTVIWIWLRTNCLLFSLQQELCIKLIDLPNDVLVQKLGVALFFFRGREVSKYLLGGWLFYGEIYLKGQRWENCSDVIRVSWWPAARQQEFPSFFLITLCSAGYLLT